ncbi:MAG: 2-phosphosulfolactate phosphatase, partial [Moorea sp. SIO2B7]|nr:2-phosphosulfolactate phosphatase [Moorena sp. SIO2B7]
MKLFVYHTPELTPTDSLPDCAVVIDVLRATTTIATALNAGAEAVQAFSDIEKLMQVSEAWHPDKRLRAGERGGAKVDGFDLGNSPLDCTPDVVKGKRRSE